MPNTATPLPSETPYLRLDRADRTRAIEHEIDALDRRLNRAESPHDPTASVVRVGYTEKFVDPYDASRVSWVHQLAGHRKIIVIVPADLDTTAVASAVEVLVDTALAEREAGLSDR